MLRTGVGQSVLAAAEQRMRDDDEADQARDDDLRADVHFLRQQVTPDRLLLR